MKRSAHVLGAVALGLIGCREDRAELPPRARTVPNVTSGAIPLPRPDSERPSPTTDTCQSTCANLEVVGPTSLLVSSTGHAVATAAITYGNDAWFVAWSAGTDRITRLQRFDRTGSPDGPTKQIDATRAASLALQEQPTAELLLHGAPAPFDHSLGWSDTIHRLDPSSLEPVGAPFSIRTASVVSDPGALVPEGGGSTTLLQTLTRAVPVVREIQLSPSLGTSQTPVLRDWFVASAKPPIIPMHIGPRRLVTFHEALGVSVAPLEDGGTVGPATSVVDGFPTVNGEVRWYEVWSRVIGSAWWVGAVVGNESGGQTIRVRRVDPETRQPIGETVAVEWNAGRPSELIDANGSPVIVGTLGRNTGPLVSFVPLDVDQRATCRPSTVRLESGAVDLVSLLRHRFVGDTGGVLLIPANAEARGAYFALLRCRP